MRLFTPRNLVSVLFVTDYARALDWYSRWLGKPDEIPMDGMAEWAVAGDNWLQLDSSAAQKAGHGAVVIGVDDVAACREAWLAAGIAAGKITDYGFVKVCDAADPDGNRVSLVEMTA